MTDLPTNAREQSIEQLKRELDLVKRQMIYREELLRISDHLRAEVTDLALQLESARRESRALDRRLSTLVERTGLLKNEACSTRERFTTIELKIDSFCREWSDVLDQG